MASPFGRAVLVVNPRAGRGVVGREMPEVERQLLARNLAYRIVETEAPGHATEVVREALAGDDRFIVAVGGDGTVHEVVNGMVAEGRPVASDAVLGVVAAGSGCDFVRTFGLPGDAIRSVKHLTGERTLTMDVGEVAYRHGPEERRRYFPNIAEAGLGGAVAARAERLPRWFGRGRYFVGFWLSLARHRATPMTVRADRKTFEGRANNVVVANCQFYGAGMRISPRSYPSDGLLDVQISTGPKFEAFTLLPKIYRGEHVPHPRIVEYRAREVSVEAERPLPIEADGEILGHTPATFRVVPEAIRLKI